MPLVLWNFWGKARSVPGFTGEAFHMYMILQCQSFTLAQPHLTALQNSNSTRATFSKLASPLCGCLPNYPWYTDCQLQWFRLRKHLATSFNLKHLNLSQSSCITVASGVNSWKYLCHRNDSSKHHLQHRWSTFCLSQHIFRELISSSSTCLLPWMPKWSGQYLYADCTQQWNCQAQNWTGLLIVLHPFLNK